MGVVLFTSTTGGGRNNWTLIGGLNIWWVRLCGYCTWTCDCFENIREVVLRTVSQQQAKNARGISEVEGLCSGAVVRSD